MAITVKDGKRSRKMASEEDIGTDVRPESGKPDGRGLSRGRKGMAVVRERERAEYALTVIPEEEKARVKWVEDHVIFGRNVIKYRENEDDPEQDYPSIAFRLWTDMRVLHTFASVCALIGVVESTGYEWMKHHERFRLAVEMGKKLQEHFQASRMAQGVMYPTSLIFTMKNVHGWADRIENTHKVSIAAVIADVEAKAKPVDWDNPNMAHIPSPQGGTFERDRAGLIEAGEQAGEQAREQPEVLGSDGLPESKEEGTPWGAPWGG
jgi:hypothetical protein